MLRLLLTTLLLAGSILAKDVTPENVVPGEVIFKLGPETALIRGRTTATGLSQVDGVLSRYQVLSVEPMFPTKRTRRRDLPDISRIYVAKYDSDANPHTVAKELEKLRFVIYAEPKFVYRVEEIPDDPLYSDQWHLSKILTSAAWDIAHGDASVVVAVVDNGFDMDHPDLEANYFTNPGEISDNGVDDDQNGYVDDVHGWDFGSSDNDPNHGPEDESGFWVHGTHVAGLANAVTNNGVGVAGVAWNVRTLPVKGSYDDVPQFISFGYEGIVYAAELGAHVINCSWGGFGYSRAAAETVEYASGLGSLIVAAAGNDNSDLHHYPSAYEEVLSVAATGSNDTKAGFSNYGLSIDVSAPGVSTQATFPDGEYGTISGTSMSSPIAAGLVGLVKSRYPDLTAKQLALRVAGTAHNIDGENSSYVGLLGTGRIDAPNALALNDSEFVAIPPKIELFSAGVTDSVSGDGNGLFDRGETIDILPAYRNYSLGGAQEYSVTLSTNDPDLTILGGATTPALFPPDTTLSSANELSFAISETAEPHMAEVALDVLADGDVQASDVLALTVGKMPILIVKDGGNDGGAGGNTSVVDGFYTGILDELGILYGVWDHGIQGTPSADILGRFPTVIWFTEWAFPSLDDDDRRALRDYLDSGGNLYISGQDLGWDLNENPGSDDQTSFFRDYLHAVWGGDDADNMNVEGFFGDPISHGLSFKIYQPGIDRDSQFPDWFSRDSEAVLIFQYGNGKGMGLRFDGGYRLVYTGVGLEAFGSTINSTPPQDINDIQRTVLSRILRYLNFVHHTPLTDTETTEADFSIGVKVTGDISDLERVTLFYRTDGVGDFMGVDMADGGGGQYSGIIPAPMADTYVNYYIEIENSYYVWTNPVGAPTDAFSFYAGPDTVAPVVVFVSDLEDRIDRSGTDQVTTFVSDNIGIDEVQLVWTISSEASEDTVLMTFDGNLWTGQLTWDGVPGNTVITYQIVATDVSTGQNVGWSDPKSFKIVNRGRITGWEDESIAGWDTGDSWGLELKPDERGYVMDDFPYENYLNNANNILTRIDPIDVSPYNSAYLSFLHVAVLDSGKDFGFVELSNNGTDWTTVATITGLGVVRYEIIDVSSYINEPELRLRFRMTSDDSVTFSGWSVDDVYLLVDTTLSVVEEAQASLPEKFSLEQNYPNPFNPTTTIAFSLPRSGNVELVVYDLLGREVATLLNGWRPAGRHEVVWNASAMATGVYLYRLKSGDFAKTKKLLLLK